MTMLKIVIKIEAEQETITAHLEARIGQLLYDLTHDYKAIATMKIGSFSRENFGLFEREVKHAHP